MAERYRLADNVVCRQTSEDLRMLFDRTKGVMYELNETASAVIGHFGERPASVAAIAAVLVEEFDAPPDEVRADLDRMLADFLEAGLVVAE